MLNPKQPQVEEKEDPYIVDLPISDQSDSEHDDMENVNPVKPTKHPFSNYIVDEDDVPDSDDEYEDEYVDQKSTYDQPNKYNFQPDDIFWNMPPLLSNTQPKMKPRSMTIYETSNLVKLNQTFENKEDFLMQLRTKCVTEGFQIKPNYSEKLRLSNPGSVTNIRTDNEGRFVMSYMSIGAATRSFVNYARPVIIVDGAHLKSCYLGTNLIAIAMDANNGILPLAYGIRAGETTDHWTWFFGNLRDSLQSSGCCIDNLTIISDRAPAIAAGISIVFPEVFHALCARHLLENLKNSTRTLTTVGLNRWSRHHTDRVRYAYLTTNSAESMNALSVHARKLPVTMLLEFFRASVQQWFWEHRNTADGLTTPVTPYAERKLGKRNRKSLTWSVKPISQVKFEVMDMKKAVKSIYKIKLAHVNNGSFPVYLVDM
ncbi:uncharacterized protein [Rutidosis leptorrhynchoides]|uniref:uncharacterized protein n=1 Tax=Rutidosis leptorrhynchoides TaxID=125765 RepID=UPI003A99BE26